MGLQETRSREVSVTTTGTYLSVPSTCDPAGNYGSERWVSKRLRQVLKPGSYATLRPPQLTVVHEDPRRLVVTVVPAGARLFLASFHAPHFQPGGSTEEEADGYRVLTQWLKDTALVYGAAATQFPHSIVFTDANVSLGSLRAFGVGGDMQGLTSKHVTPFIRFLEQTCHRVSSPYRENQMHSVPHQTFKHGYAGTPTVLDYILVPQAVGIVPASVRPHAPFRYGNGTPRALPSSCSTPLLAPGYTGELPQESRALQSRCVSRSCQG